MMDVVRRAIMEPFHGWVSKSPKLKYWRELEGTQYLSESRLKEIQWYRLKGMLQFVWENNEFYLRRFQASGVSPKTIRSPEDLRLLPLLNKAEIRANTPAMISRGFVIDELQKAKTGGSTGKPLELYFTENCSELRNACARRHDRWSGWEVGEPVGAVWGNPDMPHNLKEKLKHWLLAPCVYLDTMRVIDETVIAFTRSWKKAKPTLLFGHAHSLYLLAQYVQRLGINEIQPKAIISTSMMLLPHEREFIERVFHVRVSDRYGCEEVSLIASECEKHEGLHLNIEHLYIEFLGDDGSPVKAGEPGRIVVTDLMNYAMPFIRYEVEDVGVPTDAKCSCGRGLPLIAKVYGRIADFLVKADGTRVAGVSLIENTLTSIPGIYQMQIIQEAVDQIIIRIVPGVRYCANTVSSLIAYFQDVFGHNSQVIIETINAIPSETSGKYRFSICKVGDECHRDQR